MKVLTTTLAILLIATLANAEDKVDPVADAVVDCIKNISSMAQWTGEKAVTDKEARLFVAVVGETDLASRLKALNRTETSDGHKLTVRRVDLDLLPSNAHAVVISVEDTTLARKIVKKLAGTHTFTIAVGPSKVGALLHCRVDPKDSAKAVCEASQAVATAEKITIQKPLTTLAQLVE